jgi:chaperonin GroEL
MSEKETKIGFFNSQHCSTPSLASSMTHVLDKMSFVSKTSGPSGLFGIVQSSYGDPKITKDGYSLVKAISFNNELDSLSLQLIKGCVEKTNKEAGDGTTYTFNIFSKAWENLSKLGLNVIDLDIAYGKVTSMVQDVLAKMSKKIDVNNDDVRKIATISANGDKIVGDAIADAMKQVGAEGVITVEDSKSSEKITTEHKSGMNLDRGFVSPYFATNAEKMICEMDDAYVLITNKKITNIQQILKVLEGVSKAGKSLFIIADDLEGEALTTLIINRIQGRLKVCAIKAPGFGDKRTEILKDIAILTGGQVIVDETGDNLEEIELIPGVIGSAKRIIVSKDTTIIVGGAGNEDDVKARSKFIKNQIKECDSEYEKEKLQERLAKLSGGVAVIKVGGTTELEVKELKDRIEDALNATRAAVVDGVVPGGGVAQLAIAHVIAEEIEKDMTLSRDAKFIIERILDAFSVNIRHIVSNTGKSADVVINILKEQFKQDKLSFSNLKVSKVYDALHGKYIDAYETVIDPTKVIRVAFMNAINTVYMLLKTGGVVYFANEEKAAAAPMNPGMGGMGGMDY